MKCMFAALAATGLLLTAGADQQGVLDPSANTYTITVAKGAADVTLSPEDVTALGKSVALVKKGEGRLIVATDLKTAGYDGEIRIEEGYFRTMVDGSLGGTTAGTIISSASSSGATLEVYDWTTSVVELHPYEPITFEGSGVDGHGAIYAVNAGTSIGYINNSMLGHSALVMTGDATVGYAGPEGFEGTFALRNCQSFDMGGHTLTVQGTGAYSGVNGLKSVKNPGHIVIKSGCPKFVIQSESVLSGSSANTFTIEDGVNLNLLKQPSCYWGGWSSSPWTLIVKGSSQLQFETQTSGGDDNGWNGPVRIDGTLDCVIAGTVGKLDGPISGQGGLTVSRGKLYLQGRRNDAMSNTYRGNTLVKSGATLVADYLAMVPADNGRLVVESGATTRLSSSSDTTVTADLAMAACLSVTTNEAYSATATDFLIDSPAIDPAPTYSEALMGPMTLYGCFGLNAGFRLASELSDGVAFYQKAGRKTVIATGGDVGKIELDGGVIDIAAGATVENGENGVFIGGTYPQVGRLQVHGTLESAQSATYGIAAGSISSRAKGVERGIFEMFDGATVTGRIDVRNRNNDKKARTMESYFIHGGTFTEIHRSQESFWADACNGYFAFEGGMLVGSGSYRIGRNGKAVIRICGGTVCLQKQDDKDTGMNNFVCGVSGGTTDILIDNGGKLICENTQLQLGRPIEKGEVANLGRKCSMAVIGEGSLASFDFTPALWWGAPLIAACNNAISSISIMDGGRFLTSSISTPSTGYAGGGSSEKVPLVGNVAIVSFDDGTLCCTNNSQQPKVFSGFETGVDHVLVNGGGATIEAGQNFALGAALEAPTGNGIASIALPEGIAALAAWEYTGAPRVEISDPTGVGAAAVALFDSANGVITGFNVTCAGINYTNPSVTVSGGGYTQDFTFTEGIVLAENRSGGFTKTGAATLTVDQVCSYTGVTTVAAGTLKLDADDAIKTSAGLAMAGGTLDANGKAFDLPLLGGCGTVKNLPQGLTTVPALAFRAEDLVAKRTLSVDSSVTLPAGAVVSVDDVDALEGAGRRSFVLITSAVGISGPLPELGSEFAGKGYRLVLTNAGKTLKLCWGGLAIVVR